MKLLNGTELVDFIKVRQLKQVRGLRQAEGIIPRLAIVRADDNNKVIDTYIRLKQKYAKDILIEVDVYNEPAGQIIDRLKLLATDEAVHGIIVQLPLPDGADVDEILSHILPSKDVDGLASSEFTPATPMAISWLLAGYGIDLADKNIAIVGRGRLVGAPLEAMWREAGYNISVFDKDDGRDLSAELPNYDVVITATGVPGLITSQMLKPGAIVVDAGTASENGVIKGDVAADVRTRSDLTITPAKGGVGPLTVAALFDNVILAARRRVKSATS